MLQGLFRHLRSNVVAYVALFVAFGAGAYAASDKAPKNSVVSKSIKNGQVKQKDIGQGAVTGGAIADGAVGSAAIGENAVRAGEIEDGGVGSADLSAGAVTAAKLAPGTISAGDGVVSSERIAINDDPNVAGGTTVPLLTSGPFSISVECTEQSVSQSALEMVIKTTEGAYVLESSGPGGTDFVQPNVETAVGTPVSGVGPNDTRAGQSVYALSQDGDFLTLGTMWTSKPSNSTVDCLVHGSGLAG